MSANGEGASPHLISALDGITEIVLDNIKIPTENAEQLIPFLARIKKAYGNPVALVSDMGKGIMAAIKEVFQKIPHFLCHFHFLRDLGKDFFGAEHDTIRNRLRKHGIQERLRKRVRGLKQLIFSTADLFDGFVTGIDSSSISEYCPVEYLPSAAAYTLIMWALEGKNQGQGFGFPFDQPYLIFYQRVKKLISILRRLINGEDSKKGKHNRIYEKIFNDLVSVSKDRVLAKTASDMEEKLKVFNKLRTAMRITLPENKRGLNDEGELCKIKTIEKEVKKFRDRLYKDKHYPKDAAYRKMIEQLDKYWGKLFSDPIVVKTDKRNIVIQPQRTNNILERFFRDLSRHYRKKSGNNRMERTLKAMFADTLLVKNLENKEYLAILLNGRKSLEERFSEIDLEVVKKELNRLKSESETLSPKIKRLTKKSDLPELILSFFNQSVSISQQTSGSNLVRHNKTA